MKLHLAAIAENDIELGLSISFSGEQEIEVPGGKRLGLPGGRVTFGTNRGDLKFTLKNCTLPLEKIALSKPFKVSIEVERQQTQSREFQAVAALNPQSVGAKASTGSGETISLEVFQVKQVGSEDNPRWVFEAYGDRAVLEGLLQQTLLGMLCIAECPCEVEAAFTVRGEDIRITWGKLVMTQNIHRNKLAVIERAIALRYLHPIVESKPISAGRWHHG